MPFLSNSKNGFVQSGNNDMSILSQPSMIQKIQQKLMMHQRYLQQTNEKSRNNSDSNRQQLPDILDIKMTENMRQKNLKLRRLIDDTIEMLLRYSNQKNRKNKERNDKQNINMDQDIKMRGEQQLENLKDEVKEIQILQRFTFIFSQMNELNGDIDETIKYLNEGGVINQRQKKDEKIQMGMNKMQMDIHKQQMDVHKMQMDSEEDNKNQRQQRQISNQCINMQCQSPNYCQISLDQRFQGDHQRGLDLQRPSDNQRLGDHQKVKLIERQKSQLNNQNQSIQFQNQL